MPVPFRYTTRVNVPGIDGAEDFLSFYLRRHMDKLGPEIRDDIREEQRLDTGEERRKTRYRIYGRKTTLSLSIFNDTIQAAVDETGARPHFPPYRIGSKLFRWVQRHGMGATLLGAQSRGISAQARAATRRELAGRFNPQLVRLFSVEAGRKAVKDTQDNLDKRTERISFLIARAQSKRGLPRPGDLLNAPFKDVEARQREYIRQSFIIPVLLATKAMNDAKRANNVTR